MTQGIGPVELIVLGFDGNHFNGAVVPSLMDLVDRGIIRIIDMAVVIKDALGRVTILEAGELDKDVARAFEVLTGSVPGLLSEADIVEIAASLPPDSTEAVLLVEHVWATGFAQAVRASGGQLLMSERIPGDVVDAARATLVALASAVEGN
jgi:hypothetical protein